MSPEYPVTVLFAASLAVIVKFWEAPAVCEEAPDDDQPGRTSSSDCYAVEEADLPLAEIAVNVPVPIVPVYLMPSEFRVATPWMKSEARFSTLLLPVPRPVMVPEAANWHSGSHCQPKHRTS